MGTPDGEGRGPTSRPDKAVTFLRETDLMCSRDDVTKQVEMLLETGPRSLAVDLSGVDVTSTTVTALLWVKRRCAARGVEVALLGPARRSVHTLKGIGFVDAGQRPTILRSPPGHSGPPAGSPT